MDNNVITEGLKKVEELNKKADFVEQVGATVFAIIAAVGAIAGGWWFFSRMAIEQSFNVGAFVLALLVFMCVWIGWLVVYKGLAGHIRAGAVTAEAIYKTK